MKYYLDCVILEVTEKHFRTKEDKEQVFYVAQAYQPGNGVAEISLSKEVKDNVQLGKNGTYSVEIRNGKPRIVAVIK